MTSATGAARPFLQEVLRVSSGAMKGRCEAEQEPGDNGTRQRESKDVQIDSDLFRARQGARRGRQDQVRSETGEQQAGYRPRQRQQYAFSQELTDDASACGAERGPNSELPLPGCGARQQQIRGIRARDNQYE